MALQTLTEEDREYYFMLSGMVESLYDFSSRNANILFLRQAHPGKTEIHDVLTKSFAKSNPNQSSSTTRIISSGRPLYDEESIMDDKPSSVDIRPMAHVTQISEKDATFTWKGTSLSSPYEINYSLNGLDDLIDGGNAVLAASHFGKDTVGYVRTASIRAFMAENSYTGSLYEQTRLALHNLNDQSRLRIGAHSMGAAMAIYTALTALEMEKFSKIYVYLWGSVDSVSETLAQYLKDRGVVIKCCEIDEDPVPRLDSFMKLVGRLFPVTSFYGPLRSLQQRPGKSVMDLMPAGKQFRAFLSLSTPKNPFTAHSNKTYMSGFSTKEMFKAYQPVDGGSKTLPNIFVEQRDLKDLMQQWNKTLWKSS